MHWFFIILEFDFTIEVKQGKTHLRVDHLGQLKHEEKPIGVDDNLLEAYLFKVEMILKWSKHIYLWCEDRKITKLDPKGDQVVLIVYFAYKTIV